MVRSLLEGDGEWKDFLHFDLEALFFKKYVGLLFPGDIIFFSLADECKQLDFITSL